MALPQGCLWAEALPHEGLDSSPDRSWARTRLGRTGLGVGTRRLSPHAAGARVVSTHSRPQKQALGPRASRPCPRCSSGFLPKESYSAGRRDGRLLSPLSSSRTDYGRDQGGSTRRGLRAPGSTSPAPTSRPLPWLRPTCGGDAQHLHPAPGPPEPSCSLSCSQVPRGPPATLSQAQELAHTASDPCASASPMAKQGQSRFPCLPHGTVLRIHVKALCPSEDDDADVKAICAEPVPPPARGGWGLRVLGGSRPWGRGFPARWATR